RAVAIELVVVRARLGAGLQQVVLAVALGLNGQHAAALELPGYAAVLAQAAAVLGQQVAHVGDGAVLVVGEHLDDQRRARRAAPLIARALVVLAAAGPRAAGDGALHRLLGHGRGLALVHQRFQRGVVLDVAAA